MIILLATVHFNFQSPIVFELADNTLCCNIMQYLSKIIIGDVTFSPLWWCIQNTISDYHIKTDFTDWQIAFEKADSIMIVNRVQIMNNHHKAVRALKDADLFRGKWLWCLLLHAENLFSKSPKQDRPVSSCLAIAPYFRWFFLFIFQNGLFPHSYIVLYDVSTV